MQRIRKCLGVDIGASSIKIAEIIAEKAGVRVSKLAVGNLDSPVGPMDSQRIEAVARRVRDLLKENKITTKQAVFAVPGQSVFIRRIRVPRTSEERLHRIVAYEAKQQIPFALDNSAMEYQVFDYGDAAEVEVLLVAIKKDIVAEFMKIVNKTGLKPLMVSVSSLALFNFHVFEGTPFDEFQAEMAKASGKRSGKKAIAAEEIQSPDDIAVEEAAPKKKGFKLDLKLPKLSFGKKKQTAVAELPDEELPALDFDNDMGYEEVRAYVNIGAQTFDLAITRLGKHKSIGFTRSVPWAGNELSRALQDKLGLDSIAAAEEVKRSRAMVVVPGREDEIEEAGADPDASEFTTGWADRLIIDLRKSFDFYISQPDGMAVDSIIMSGGQALQRNLPAYVEEKLGIPVEVKAHVDNAAVKLPADLPDEGVSPFVIAMGLGLTGIGYGQAGIDFLPQDLKTIREFKKKNVEMILLAGAILGMLFVSTQAGNKKLQDMQQWLSENSTAIEKAQATESSIKQARTDRDAVDQGLTALGQAVGDRAFWLEFMGVIESIKPADVLITSFKMMPDGKVQLRCETTVVGSISTFADKLKLRNDWVVDVDVSGIEQTFSQFIGRQVFTFMISADAVWKSTRLDPARVTLSPGMLTPTPTPIATTPPSFGGTGIGGVPEF